MIKFVNVSKNYGETIVFKNATFEILPGECVAVTGESGAGKTTLINLLIGTEKPSIGSITIDNFQIEQLSLDDLQIFRRSIGVIFQDFKLLASKTVFENVAFALEATGESDGEIKMKVYDVLKKVGLENKMKSFPHQLSGGEKQRVAIARALSHDPKMIIADEPTGNLDKYNSDEVLKLIKRINAEGITVIVATHNHEVLNMLNPRLVWIEKGEVKVSGIDKRGEGAMTSKIDLS